MEKKTQSLDTGDLEIKSIDEKKRIIWHKVSKEVVDRMGDIIRIDGINTKNFKKKPAVLYGHNYGGMNPVPVIGKNIGFKKEGKSLYAGTQFLPTADDEPSQALKDLINDNWILHKMKLLGWSIGFIPKVTEKVEKDEKFIGYDYKESELLEYSSVIIPANQEAVNDAIKNGIVSKAVVKDWPTKDEKAIGELTEEILTDISTFADIGKTQEELETHRQQGLTPDLIKVLIEKFDSIVQKKQELKKLLENLTRR